MLKRKRVKKAELPWKPPAGPMINSPLNDRIYRLVADCSEKVAEVNGTLTEATFDFLTTTQRYWLRLPSHFSEITSACGKLTLSLAELEKAEREYAAETAMESLKAGQLYLLSLLVYMHDFMIPYWTAANSFMSREKDKITRTPLPETMLDYFELLKFNLQVAEKGMSGALKSIHEYSLQESERILQALINTHHDRNNPSLREYSRAQARKLEALVYGFPEAIRAIKPQYGFHFESGGYEKTAETDRFVLYQVFSRGRSVAARKEGKPIVIVPPYVLGANILALLPDEGRSYVHAFADQGIPTYIRVMKDINTTAAVQSMTGEDDALDTKQFCEFVKKRHGRAVTLNGFCQGGFMAVLDILSGELDGLVDALITCVAPMDGTRSIALVEYMQHLPSRFRDLGYAVKETPEGNRIVDGKVMSWVYKLKSMEKEFSLVTLFRDLMNLPESDHRDISISPVAAAMNHWLIYDRYDLPENITKLSFKSYTIPVAEDGTLPVTMFGKKL
ncbi:MAG: hypothetical protein PHU03_02525, partial [Syntrophales bacterium]|nr:hypothetical protein [Syntrophales bacterium]